jgi:polyisoprenoid-binding protein YceI
MTNTLWRRGVIGLALLGLAALPARAQPAPSDARYVLNTAHSRFGFSIGHFFVSSTEGQFTRFDGRLVFPRQAPERGTVTIHVSPGSVDTGIAARDDHLRTPDFFDVAQYPLASFESSSLVESGTSSGKLTGLLTLHGVTKPVSLDVTLETPDLTAASLKFSARGTLKRSDFGMTGFMGVIGDDVSLTIEAEFDKQD